MIKIFLKSFLYLLILILIGIGYLSYFGIETDKFNNLIKEEISKGNADIDIELEKVTIVLNLKNLSIGLKTNNSNIIFKGKKIALDNVQTNFSMESFLKKEFAIKNTVIKSKENNIQDIIKLVRLYKNSPQLFFLDKMTTSGLIIVNINFNFDNNGKIKKDYLIKGKIKNAKFKLLNKKIINNISFNFEINDNDYLFKDNKAEYEKIKLYSEKIQIKNKDKYFLIEGNIENSQDSINLDLLSVYFENNFKNLGFSNLKFFSSNDFSFRLDKKFKISSFNIKSKIDLKNLNYENKKLNLINFLPSFKDTIILNDHNIKLIYKKKKLSIIGNGKYLLDKNEDKINYNINLTNNNYEFNSKIQFNNNPLLIKILNYDKKENKNSSLELVGLFKKNKSLILKKILFEEASNKILLEELFLNKKFKINSINNLELNILSKNEKFNKISFKKNKENYELNGKMFDASILIGKILESDNNNETLSILNNFNSNIIVKVDKTYIDKTSYINNLSGLINFNNSKINQLKLESNFSNNRKIILTINKNENNEKVTTLFSEHPKPLVERYKFIKGFEDGVLDFQSKKKNNVSKSVLKIDNFKVKEVPALAKLLSLASLQGIADLLTGEGIRFTDFEMIFSNKDKLMTIDEIYAIGPAISIMMSGYIQNKDLISLRGTLVPARTINRTIASIPLIGNILIGKKVGEGVFGVSFKIKGPPKDLKTTVNPIKTLTPRFITRTLEKIKKTN